MKRVLTIVFALAFAMAGFAQTVSYHWDVNTHSYEGNMSITGIVEINGVEQQSTDLEVGAFCGEECRGRAMAEYNPTLDRNLFFLTVYGENDHEISFRIYDHVAGEELDLTCDSSLEFVVNEVLGTPYEPYEFVFLSSYDINATASPAAGGTVAGTGAYLHFASCTLTATPATGYHFVNWTSQDGAEVSTNATYTFEVTNDASYVANFEINTYDITVSANPAAGGTVTGENTYAHFSTCTLTATANTGYHFVNWTLDGTEVSTDATYSFEVTGEGAYVANFELNSYQITATANPTAGGTIAGANTYNHFSTCTLTATPATGYHFVNWTSQDGAEVSTNASYSFEVTGPASFVANFAINTYEITVSANPAAGGTVTGGNTYEHFSNCTLTATPSTGYHFVNWTLNGTEVSTQATYSFEVTGAGAYVANFEINTYEITVSANPAAGGTVTGENTYEHFSTCTLTATANTGYHFVNWTLDGTEVSTDATYSFEVTGAGAYVANFELNSYQITATANPTACGSVTGANTYNHFSTCTLTATPATGYHFVNWTLDGVEMSTNATYSFEVTGPASFVANFAINTYDITVSANPAVGGTVTGGNTYEHFSNCTLMATAATGYHFANWTLDGIVVSTEAAYTFEVTGGGAYVANFELNSYEITATVNPANSGTVTGANTYNHFSTCTLTATPATGYHFVNWTLDGVEMSTNATYSFEVTGPASYMANFALNSYEITATVNPANSGTVTGANTYNHFATCELTATANTGYTFVNWTLEGVEVSTDATYSFEVTGAANYVANFSLNSYPITVTANPAAGGTVGGAGNYDHFASCTVTATPATGYNFINWTVDGVQVSADATYTFTVTGACDLVAHFSTQSYVISASANPAAGGVVTGSGGYDYGDQCTLTATANSGYTFVNWTLNGDAVSTNATYSFSVTGNATYVANFSVNSYEITATANPTAGGTVTGAGSFEFGTTQTLIATANTGYHFVNWTLDGTQVSTNATYTFEVAGNANYVANFELNNYQITATAIPNSAGTVTGAGAYDHFATCELTATPSVGYHFVNWTLEGVEVSTNAIYSFEVTGAGNYVANFVVNSYEITVVANPTAGGTVTGAATYNHFATCQLTATANTGYHFLNWTLDGVVVSTNAIYSFEVTGAGIYEANFELNSYEITATADPTEGGTIAGADTYDYGTMATLTATPAEHYVFVKWTENGTEVSTNATYSFTVTGNRNLVANFAFDYNWEVDVNAYANNMTIVGIIRIDGDEQTSELLEIGAFCGEECRGVERLTNAYYTTTGHYYVFLTVYGNNGDELNFRLYDHATGEEVDRACSPLTFSANATVGTTQTPHIFDFVVTDITQPTTMALGWNWWSSYVEADNLMDQLKTGLGTNGKQIKSQTKFTQYNATLNMWIGQLNDIDNESTYMIETNNACSVELTGNPASPVDHEITLNPGWNWIGYPNSAAMSVTTAFSNIIPTQGDQVKSQNGFSQYNAALQMWIGNLNAIQPGMGLQYKSNATSNVTLVYPEAVRNAELVENVTNENNYWTNDVHAYPSNMTVTAVVELDDVELQSESYEVAAFANGECRGSARLMYVAPLNRYMAFLTISGDEASELYFSLYDAETGDVEMCQGASLQYATNAIVGDVEMPYVISFRSTTGVDEFGSKLHIFPNPVRRGEMLSIDMPAEGLGKVQVEVVNALGQVVETVCTSSVQTITVPSVAGVYTLRIIVEGNGTYTRKLVVR